MKIIVVVFFLTLVSATSYSNTEVIKCGNEWINIHKGNADLIGIYVQQYPDNVIDKKDYENKHPVLIIYMFKHNQKHIISYSPTGQVQDGVWANITQSDDWIWPLLIKDMRLDLQCKYWAK